MSVEFKDYIKITEDTVYLYLQDFSNYYTKNFPNEPFSKRTEYIADRCNMFLFENDNYNLIIDSRGESPRFLLNLSMAILKALNFSVDKTKLLTCIEPNIKSYGYKVDYSYFSDHKHFNYIINDLELDWNKKVFYYFSTYCDSPSEEKAMFTRDLANLHNDKSVIVWLKPDVNEFTNVLRYKGILHPYEYPLLLNCDKFSDNFNIDTINTLSNSIINIVQEDHDQNDNQVLVTDNTFKAFAMYQIPIFLATPGHVNIVRDLGFDLFDDIIDHSYNNKQVHNYNLKVLSVLKKFIDTYPTIQSINDLRNKIYNRLKNNAKILNSLGNK